MSVSGSTTGSGSGSGGSSSIRGSGVKSGVKIDESSTRGAGADASTVEIGRDVATRAAILNLVYATNSPKTFLRLRVVPKDSSIELVITPSSRLRAPSLYFHSY